MTPFNRAGHQVFTPLLTPFRNGKIDLSGFEAAIDRQVVAGIDGIIVCDIIGEGPTLAETEREILLKTAIARGKPHLNVIVSTGANCTDKTIARCRAAEEAGADALMVTVPYYSKPSLRGVFEHFRQICAAVSIPVIVDDDPGRTAKDYGPALLTAIMPFDLIVGVCHGVDRLGYFAGLPVEMKQRFAHFSRDDGTLLAFLDLGGGGAVSPLANIIPSPVQMLAAMTERPRGAEALVGAMAGAAHALGGDDVAALKEAQAFIHQSSADLRLPLFEPEPEAIIRLRHAFAPFARCEPSVLPAAA